MIMIGFFIGFFTVSAGFAGEINTSFFSNVAIDGYDPVGHLQENRPVKGTAAYKYKWKDAEWHFASAKNRDLFASNPEKFSPQYGGHCANGMSEGHKVSGNPEIWRIVDGKLYYFYSHNGRNRWSNNTAQWIIDAQRNWEKLKYK